MNFADFHSYNDSCIICGEKLAFEAELLCFIDIGPSLHPGLCGINYYYHEQDNKFYKGDFFYSRRHKTVSKKIFDTAIDTFSVNARYYPRFGKSKMESGIKKGSSIASMELTYIKHCQKPPFDENDNDYHDYGYNSGILFSTPATSNDELYIDYEAAIKYGYHIQNILFDNKICESFISHKNNINLKFDPIPITKWNFTDKNTLQKQIEKYAVLK